MADINKEINAFKEAIYGKDVRNSLVSLAEKVNAESEEAVQSAAFSAEEAKTAHEIADEAALNADSKAVFANKAATAANNAAINAEEAKKAANTAAELAANAAEQANTKATEAQSAADAANEIAEHLTTEERNIFTRIQAKGETVLESIPNDYEAMGTDVEVLKAGKADVITQTATGTDITLTDSADAHLVGLKVFGRTEQAQAPTPENPQELVNVGASGSITQFFNSRNLFNYITAFAKYIVSAEGVIKSNLTSDQRGWSYQNSEFKIKLSPGTYCLVLYSDVHSADTGCGVRVINKNDVTISTSNAETMWNKNIVFTLSEEQELGFMFKVYTSEFRVMLNKGGNALSWIPFKQQTFTIQTPDGLRGIPVTMGGNYTDRNGQQWIADTIEYDSSGAGRRVQRTRNLIYNGSETIELSGTYKGSFFAHENDNALKIKAYTEMVCSHAVYKDIRTQGYVYGNCINNGFASVFLFKAEITLQEVKAKLKQMYDSGNPLIVIYQLENPIVTELTTEEIAVLGKLQTYKPVTLISNNESAYQEVEYNADTKTYVDKQKNDVTTEFEDIRAYLGYAEEDIAGLQVDYANKTFKRLAGASNLVAGTDFNKFEMFGGRKRCTVSDVGEITSFFGEETYKEDGTMGQVMVYQPKFYYRVVPVKIEPIKDGIGHHLRKANYYVSSKPKTGFKLHPLFVDRNGEEIEYALLSAYEGSIYDTSTAKYLLTDEQVADFTAGTGDKFCSIGGAKPASGKVQNLTRPNIESLAQNRGEDWHVNSVKAEAANQLLMIIEIGTMNTQTGLFVGAVNIPDSPDTENNSIATGGTTILGNGTGRATGTDGLVSISYRGVENPWGNIWKFIHGVNIYGNGRMKGGVPYICSDYTFIESKSSGNYESAGFTVSNSGGYISAMGYSEAFDYLFFPSEAVGNSALPVGDNFYLTTNLNGYRIAPLGGHWRGGGYAGGFYWHLGNDASAHDRGIGGRLVHVPTKATNIAYVANIIAWRAKNG